MPVFNYTTKDLAGAYHRGQVDTADEYQAAALLRKKKLIIISLKPFHQSQTGLLNKFLNRVSFNDVVIMTRQLATMVEAGLVLSEALDVLADQQPNKYFKIVLSEVSAEIKGGINFAGALEKYPDIFPPIYARLVKAGQASGKLDTILLNLTANLEKQREFNSKVRGAMIYPIIVVTMMIGVMLVMVFFVMPKLMGLYKDSGLQLPLPTRILIGFSDFMLNYWWIVAGGIAGAIILFRYLTSKPEGRLVFEKIVARIPVVSKIVDMVILTQFTRTFALLISAGLPILESIKIVSDIVGNMLYKQALEIVYQGVERGLSFSDQILSLPLFPKILGQMAKTGEATGKVDEILFKLADYFESESDMALKNITTLIEPLILVILGIGVALLVISIILPIYQLTTNVK